MAASLRTRRRRRPRLQARRRNSQSDPLPRRKRINNAATSFSVHLCSWLVTGAFVGGKRLIAESKNLAYALPPASDLTKREESPWLSLREAPTPTRVTPNSDYTGPDLPPSTRQSARTRETIPPEKRPSTVVVIDAGHGGFDRGGIPRQRVPEKTMNLDVAQRLRTVLEASGYRVVMTRDSDVFVPLGTRVAIANSYRNAIFVCIHFNAAPRSGANGIETYFYSNESLPLASAIHYHVAGGAPTPNRGVRRRGFFVLRRTRIPAVLVECGFLTNATEAQYVQDANYRQKLAEEIAARYSRPFERSQLRLRPNGGRRNRSAATVHRSNPSARPGFVALQAIKKIQGQIFQAPDLVRHRGRKDNCQQKEER